MRRPILSYLVAIFGLLLIGSATASAQPPEFGGLGGLDLPGLGSSGSVTLNAEFQALKGSREGRLVVTAEISKDWHLYSTTQPAKATGFPTKIKLAAGEESLKITGPFTPDRDPKIVPYDDYEDDSQEFEGEVTWTAPIEFSPSVDPEKLSFKVKLSGLICKNACIPVDQTATAKFAGYYEPPSGEYRAGRSHARVSGFIEPSVVKAGESAKLVLTLVPDDDWHFYPYRDHDPKERGRGKPTLIVLSQTGGLVASKPVTDSQPESKPGVDGQPPLEYHDKSITWTIDLAVPADAGNGKYAVVGAIGYMTCEEACDPPTGARFTAHVTVGDEAGAGSVPLTFSESSYSSVAKAAQPQPTGFDVSKVKVSTQQQNDLPFAQVLGLALLGGFILNFMPCVLPVIGLKAMSFVQQAGESRRRVFALNAWFSIGLLSVFLAVATLAVGWNVGWGEHFGNTAFSVTMAAIVFTMGLSLLGVWELPIPGFVGGNKAHELASKEGASGAFFKGVITTILATPCSGPGLATALTWCGGGKPPALVYAVFAVMGLGMASPYLLIGAFPALIRFIPKPGPWMDTFKQIMGFMLLGTVVFILSFIDFKFIVPTVAFLFGLWLACWWIGRTSAAAEFSTKVRSWLTAGAMAALVWIVAFSQQLSIGPIQIPGAYGLMATRLTNHVDTEIARRFDESEDGTTPVANHEEKQSEHELPWEVFTSRKLQKLTAANQTVLIDFTADWCASCKLLEGTVLNTQPVRKLVDENEVVTLVADCTSYPPDVTEVLRALTNSKQVPVIAIFPAGKPNEPIVMSGGYTQSMLIGNLKKAGPSKKVAQASFNDNGQVAAVDD